MRALSIALVAASTLASCSTQPQVNPINEKYMAAVLAEIKQEVGDYKETATWLHNNPSMDEALAGIPRDSSGNLLPDCGDGKLNFAIDKVKMELTTSSDNTFSAEFSATIPVSPVATVSPDVKYSNDKGATQKLTFIEYPTDIKPRYEAVQQSQPRRHGPITQTLLDLRKALIQASMASPCFSTVANNVGSINQDFLINGVITDPALEQKLFDNLGVHGTAPARPRGATPSPAAPPVKPAAPAVDKSKPDENSFALGITVTDTGGGTLKLSVAVVTLGFGDEQKSVTGNTITVTFKAIGKPVFLQ